MLNNYPVEALLKQNPNVQFIGLCLGAPIYEDDVRKDRGSIIRNLLNIWTGPSDWKVLEQYRDQTVFIDARPIKTLSFWMSDYEKDFLILAGRAAALEYLDKHISDSPERSMELSQAEAARFEVENRRTMLKLSRRWLHPICAVPKP